jgi:hypothetical protein
MILNNSPPTVTTGENSFLYTHTWQYLNVNIQLRSITCPLSVQRLPQFQLEKQHTSSLLVILKGKKWIRNSTCRWRNRLPGVKICRGVWLSAVSMTPMTEPLSVTLLRLTSMHCWFQLCSFINKTADISVNPRAFVTNIRIWVINFGT